MSISLKKIITSLVLLIVFLSPLSIQINIPTSTESLLPVVEILENSALALGRDCPGVTESGSTIACNIGDVFLGYFELIWFYLTQILVVLVGLMFDAFLFFSIDSQFYRTGIIEAGWEILRDFTNIAFILALLIQAFQLALGINIPKAGSKLMKVITVALAVNFSLFMYYAVIDASNIFAHVFCNKIDAGEAQKFESTINKGQQVIDGGKSKDGLKVIQFTRDFLEGVGADTRSVSLEIAGNINPQKTINSEAVTFGQAFIVVVMAGLINLLLIYLFGSIMLLIVGRTLSLMIYAILSPIAFVSVLIPGL